MHLGGAGTLVAGRLGESADDGGAGLGTQRQDAVVFQQHGRCRSALPGKVMMGVRIAGDGLLQRLGSILDHLQQLRQPLIHHRFLQYAAAHRFDEQF